MRTCACGQHLTPGGGECAQCRRPREATVQRAAVGSERASPRGSLQRASKPGWTGSSARSLNVGEKVIGNVRRLPIENLTEGNQEETRGAAESTKGRAIILLHAQFDPTKRAD